MRFIMMHKTEPKWEAGALPSAELIAGMGGLLGQMAEAGALLDAGGLRPSSLGVRLTFSRGVRTVTPGPFAGGNELPAGFTILRVGSIDEAIDWASRYAGVVGDVEIDIRPVTEPWDIGICPKPKELTTTRFMMVTKANQASEAAVPPAPAVKAGLETLTADLVSAGVLLAAERLQPSSRGTRLKFVGGKRTITDGPFTESKELIAGFVMLRAEAKEGMIGWATRFAALTGDVEIDVRPLYERADTA